ncbi:hypothetical protein LWI29_003441 [Acer saccharum]|uniref:Uncharacterized protein n=1 Tax=Acer saccharum TaxID=4024 RepID=A0AA39SIE8_ACESA|nr:hypothetical protein LWI29_003441 [Acer saccharum]
MHNSDQGKLDQRTNSGMEDSAMTIEFLRGRLLAERSVSKSARQRADELARRVEELEEQLKIVSLQRKKAEKATADVLAILENNGISDISETFDSSSDQEETPCESKSDNNSTKEDENSSNLKFRRNESGELSGSDHDFSPVPQRSLSWKGRKGTKHSPEKYKDSYRRRGSSFSSASSSPKHRLGKSCRQIKRKESRSMVEEVITDAIKVDSQANGVSASLEVSPNDSDVRPKSMRGGSEPQEEKLSLEGSHLGYAENEKNVSSSDMEKALEHQAQLNGKYEEMEKAQREWEERFRENNSSTPDSCDPGNQSDVTEEREEIKAQAQCPADSNNFELAKSKLRKSTIRRSWKATIIYLQVALIIINICIVPLETSQQTLFHPLQAVVPVEETFLGTRMNSMHWCHMNHPLGSMVAEIPVGFGGLFRLPTDFSVEVIHGYEVK